MDFNKIKDKLKNNLGETEFNKKVAEFTEDAKEFGFAETEMSDYLSRRFTSFMTKRASGGNKLERVEASMILLSVAENNYGKAWQYKNATEMMEKDFDKALKMGVIDADGNPLIQKGNDKGNIIDPEDVDTQYMGVVKIGEEGWKKCSLTAKKNVMPIYPLFTTLTGTFGKRNPTTKPANIEISLGPVMDSTLTIGDKLDVKSMKSLIANFYSDCIVDVKTLEKMTPEDWKEQENSKGFNRFHIVVGDTSEGVEGNEKSEWLKLNIPMTEEELVENNFVTPVVQCWINNPETEKNIKAGAMDLIVTGRLVLSETEQYGKQYNMSNVMIYADDKFILKQEEKAEPVTPTNGKPEPASEPASEPKTNFVGVQTESETPAETPNENQFA